MLKKELEGLLVMIKANEEATNDTIDKFSYTYDIAYDMVEVYNYIINTLEENAIVIPHNLKKIDINKYESEIKKIYEIVSYRNSFLSLLIESEIKKYEEKDIFEDLERFEENEKTHILEKIKLLEDEIHEYDDEIKILESEINELEKELEQIISIAREKKCNNNVILKETANTNLDIQKTILKIEKAEREIDKRREYISRKKNEISILEFQIKK